ncbi:MAG: Na+/H+ antiporter NhaA [Alphaproteobacteria bacterium]|nr:Na+/H+ antiporter NhaA [Alphaproteobacteria bacterium]MBU1515680.1 Na+/H+ antiporter NhaA [Alphaproteobacteria bacterium]MBU2094939.1 Na+/H+ antiporter NhaA [Alphaproteobacteria bacterium]MBU2150971.1 Na+/H+ antiporter NhaA [Alphaproteobacteria bacterium]MBU2305948.1 Na+/H+ antiporter NhaA [Alphaproteobacteria bacterium]
MSTRSTLAFLKTETGSGALLAAAALLAIVWANSPWAASYDALTHQLVAVRIGPFAEELTLAGWVKTALMPIFFFVVGLEIKHEILRGELSNPRRLALPLLAAAGGVVVPALVYLAFNGAPGGLRQGWPIPTATDIAFALAALAVAGPRLPPTLRIFLLTLAIADDLAAVVLIAVLFTADLDVPMLACAAVTVAALAAMSRWRAAPYFFWAVGGVLLWGFTLKSGINTSLAGIAAAFCLPLEPKRTGGQGVLSETMEALHPYVAFFILPVFAFMAAGFSLGGEAGGAIFGPVSLGIAAGLFFGKQIGVFGAAALAIGLKWARRPTGAKWLELYGVSALCGVGFTMSLFIGALAFPGADALHQAQVRAGVVMGSVAAALMGIGLLLLSARRRARDAEA